MKNVKKGKQIKRISDEEAAQEVKQGWKYCPNHEWRAFRDSKIKKQAKKAVKRQSKKKVKNER